MLNDNNVDYAEWLNRLKLIFGSDYDKYFNDFDWTEYYQEGFTPSKALLEELC
jgi:hypothetical protein